MMAGVEKRHLPITQYETASSLIKRMPKEALASNDWSSATMATWAAGIL